MITRLTMRNFKRFEEATIDLTENVVLRWRCWIRGT